MKYTVLTNITFLYFQFKVKRQTDNSEDVSSHPKLKGIEQKLVELILSEIMDHGPPIQWDDIAVKI